MNAAAFVDRGIGYALSFQNFTVDAIREAVTFVLNPNTQNEAKKTSLAFRDRMHTPAETAIWWVEHVAKTGGAQFAKSNAINLSTIEYHSIDVLAVLTLGTVIFNVILFWLVRKLCCTKQRNVQKSNKLKTK